MRAYYTTSVVRWAPKSKKSVQMGMVTAPSRNTVAEAALWCIERGLAPVHIPPREKNPGADGTSGWEKRRYTPKNLPGVFGPRDNLGMITGAASGDWVDLDLDTPEARELARTYAPATRRKHGRPSAPTSHWWYIAPGAMYHKFQFRFAQDRGATCLAEIRGDGKDGGAHQTVIPPSIHPGGEPYLWEITGHGDPTTLEARDLVAAAGIIAAGALLARLWPAKGSRDDAAMALAGWLLRARWKPDAVDRFAQAVASAAGDEEARDRAKARQTQAALRSGRSVTGRTRLAELLGADGPLACAKIAEWLGLSETGAQQSPLPADSANDSAEADSSDATAREPGAKHGPSIAAQLVKIAEQGAELWHDADGYAWATFTTPDGHREHWPLASRAFKRWLASQFYASAGQSPSAQPIADALLTLDGRAANEGTQRTVYTRLAECDGAIYLDLADDQWQAVKVTSAGWEIVSAPGVRFRRAKGMLDLPSPQRDGSLEVLRQFVNVADKDAWPLVEAWLVAALRPTGPYPILALSGEMGSAKTSLARMLRALVDPNKAPVRSAPRDDRDLALAANNGWVIALDNLSHLPGWLSDALCRLSTGGGFATRTLYENEEETIFAAQRPIIFTGVEDIATRGDLIDRALLISLEPIPDGKRKTERALWREFESARPAILGALLDAVSGALARLGSIQLAAMPRMADFAEWAVAAEGAKGSARSAFLAAYEANRKDANEAALDASPVAEQLLKLMKERDEWQGSPSGLYDALTALAGEKIAASPSWPRNAKSLSGSLKRLAPNLRRAGEDRPAIEITPGRLGDKRRSRTITLEKMREVASDASAASDEDANPENNGAQASDFADATADANEILRPQLRPQRESRIEAGSGAPADAADASDAKIPHRTYMCGRPEACAGRTLTSGRWGCSLCEATKARPVTMGGVARQTA